MSMDLFVYSTPNASKLPVFGKTERLLAVVQLFQKDIYCLHRFKRATGMPCGSKSPWHFEPQKIARCRGAQYQLLTYSTHTVNPAYAQPESSTRRTNCRALVRSSFPAQGLNKYNFNLEANYHPHPSPVFPSIFMAAFYNGCERQHLHIRTKATFTGR